MEEVLIDFQDLCLQCCGMDLERWGLGHTQRCSGLLPSVTLKDQLWSYLEIIMVSENKVRYAMCKFQVFVLTLYYISSPTYNFMFWI